MLVVGHYSHFFEDKEVSISQSRIFWCVIISSIAAGATNLLVIATRGEIVLSAAIIGTFLGLLPYNKTSFYDKNVQFSGYAGVFVGMSAPSLFVHWVMAFLAGAITGLVFALGGYSLSGVGGRLGTFAFLSVIFVLALQFLLK